MELGQRLKQARLEAGLSQRQLCGDVITRNMLSQIENGTARPSMNTLEYLARRLGKPVSYFLEEQTVTSPNLELLERARAAFFRKDWAGVVKSLERYRPPDPVFDAERFFIEAISLVELSKQAVEDGKKVLARELLERARVAGLQSPYFTQALSREWVLQRYIVQPEAATELLPELEEDHREQLLRAQALFLDGAYDRCVQTLEAMPSDLPQWQYLRGQAALKMGQFLQATEYFLAAEEVYPVDCAKALERCYRELGDFEQAYYYACKLREL